MLLELKLNATTLNRKKSIYLLRNITCGPNFYNKNKDMTFNWNKLVYPT